jgi:hypothetical protein
VRIILNISFYFFFIILDSIRNEYRRKAFGVFTMNDRISRYRGDRLEHVEEMEEGRVSKKAL